MSVNLPFLVHMRIPRTLNFSNVLKIRFVVWFCILAHVCSVKLFLSFIIQTFVADEARSRLRPRKGQWNT